MYIHVHVCIHVCIIYLLITYGNDIGPYRCGNAVCTSEILFCDVRTFLRATSAMMDVPMDEQELPEPVKLRALCEVPDEWEKLGCIRHQRTT